MSQTKKGDTTRQVVRIGLDIAKSSFQVHGVDAHGKVVLRKQLTGESARLLCPAAAVSDWVGSLWRGTLLGAGVTKAGPRRTPDGGGDDPALSNEPEE